MKNDKLQPSEELANHFAPYREEAPLISTPEVEKLLAGSAIADHPRNVFFSRRIFMTLSGLAGLAAISYFALFSNHSNVTNGTAATNGPNTTQKSYLTHPSHITPDTTELLQPATPAKQLRKMGNPHGPWSAGNDQFYADLSPEELAKLGIATFGDTVRCYNINKKNKQETWTLTAHSSGGHNVPPPADLSIPRCFPILVTMRSGHAAAFRIEDSTIKEWGMIGDNDMMEQFRNWLLKPGTPGYHLLGFTESSFTKSDCKDCPGTEYDTVKIEIVKNLPQPLLWPIQDPIVSGIPDSAIKKVVQLGHYYEGTDKKPNFEWPAWPLNLIVKVDTMTVNDLVAQLDSEENSSTVGHVRSIMARLNDLVPVIVRPKGGSGAPDSNDFIFWYEPSEELFNALPPAQAAIFRAKLAEPPHCLSMPNEVLTTAEITYCVAEPQEVQVMVRDLTGKQLIGMSQLATAGDNVLKFTTETLPSGMYIVTIQDQDRTERSQRLWVENGHPKSYKDVNWKSNSAHAPDQMWFINDDIPVASVSETTTSHPKASKPNSALEHPNLLTIPSLELAPTAIANIGIESDESVAAFYTTESSSDTAFYLGMMRNGGVIPKSVPKSSIVNINVPSFIPSFVTDGRGHKRMFGSYSDHYDSVEERQAFEQIDKLIPILLRADNTSDSVGARDLIFWYKPTPEFLALLPDSARTVAQMMASGTTSAAASVTDVHGAIQSASVYPNPSHGKFNVSINTNAKRTITLTLRNLLGQEVAPPVQAVQEGMSATLTTTTYNYSPYPALDCSNVAEGVYLLDISSDQGERYIERVVIAH